MKKLLLKSLDHRSDFTLIELLVVACFIIATVASLFDPTVWG